MSEAKWITAQKRTFTKWFNNHLVKKGFSPIKDVQKDWSNGIKLMQVVNALYDVPMPRRYNKKPRMRPHKLDNLSQAMKMLEVDADVKTNFLKSEHLLDGDEKMILGMMWSIILHYAINAISVDDLTAKEGLLLWVQKNTKGYAGVDPPKVRNFHRDWKSGLAFCALIHKHHPEMIDYDSLDKANAEENLLLAFDKAEALGIPRLCEVEDFEDKPDERSVMTYVSEFFHAFAESAQEQQALRRAGNFLSFARNMKELQNDYEKRAKILMTWIENSTLKFNSNEFGSSLEEALEHLEYFREYVVVEKPPNLGEHFDLMALLANIQTELKINARMPYHPPEGVTPNNLDDAFEKLEKTEHVYQKAARANRFKFLQKQTSGTLTGEQMKEYKTSFNHFDSNKNGFLNRAEFKAVLMLNNVPTRDEKQFEDLYSAKCGGNTEGVSFKGYIDYMEELRADKDTADQVLEAFMTLAGGNPNKITEAQLSALAPEDKQFVLDNCFQNEDGSYDFESYVSSQYNTQRVTRGFTIS